ncbi:MAG: P27 family phage terminase small subunit [Oscillospiraceae bacterium]|nr:P27 family phage terminase small subunit [Oscillospiraceae bacterium]
MARPAKPAEAGTGKIGKQEKSDRKTAENKLKGNAKNVQPAYKLTTNQRKIFNTIRKILAEAGVLGELDAYVLTATAVAADRIAEIDVMVNKNPAMMMDKDTAGVRGKYWSDFRQGCNELGLSPQARAKLGIVAAANKAKETDPLAAVLGGDEDGD